MFICFARRQCASACRVAYEEAFKAWACSSSWAFRKTSTEAGSDIAPFFPQKKYLERTAANLRFVKNQIRPLRNSNTQRIVGRLTANLVFSATVDLIYHQGGSIE